MCGSLTLKIESVRAVSARPCIKMTTFSRCVYVQVCVHAMSEAEIFHHSEEEIERDFEQATKAITAQSL